MVNSNDPFSERLVAAITCTVALEVKLAGNARDASIALARYGEVSALAADIRSRAEGHADSLSRRIADLAGDQPPTAAAVPLRESPRPIEPVSPGETLQRLFVCLSETLIATAAMQTVAHRLHDSWMVAPDGTTAHLARRHTQEYQALGAKLGATLAATIVRAFDDDGESCRCTCAACSVGFCLCAATSQAIWREGARAAAGAALDSVVIPAPKPGSAASEAGFLEGDVIRSLGGVAIDSLSTLQTAIKGYQPGDAMRCETQRHGRTLTVVIRRPETGSAAAIHAPEADDCLQPSGQAFYLDRARDLQRQIQRNGVPVRATGAGLEALSPRELQVLRFLADGATNPMIAEKLRIKRPTVARHVVNILTKLGLTNRAEAAALAAAKGLLADV
ncbi:MAG: LuxR C-terminal-related transcriptional regulator [Dehalococcoidia bacterium]